MIGLRHILGLTLWVAGMASASIANAQRSRVELNPSMVTNEAGVGDPSGLVDEQREIIGPPTGKPHSTWQLNSKFWKQFPVSAYLDLGGPKNLSSLWIDDTHGKGEVQISAGGPGNWTKVATYDCAAYLSWVEVVDPDRLAQPLKLPPEDLPRRHLFWREEMADGIIDLARFT